MNRKRISGLIGIVVGGAWLVHNLPFFARQGFVAVAMPLIILVLGIVYFVAGKDPAQ